jgi:hypothetical protein
MVVRNHQAIGAINFRLQVGTPPAQRQRLAQRLRASVSCQRQSLGCAPFPPHYPPAPGPAVQTRLLQQPGGCGQSCPQRRAATRCQRRAPAGCSSSSPTTGGPQRSRAGQDLQTPPLPRPACLPFGRWPRICGATPGAATTAASGTSCWGCSSSWMARPAAAKALSGTLWRATSRWGALGGASGRRAAGACGRGAGA